MKALIIHGFSAKNLGDGLLVEESIDMIRSAFGHDAEITLATHYPETFDITGIKHLRSGPSKKGYSSSYIRTLFKVNNFDLVIAVGGGYMRFGYPMEATKTALVHLPQLVASSVTKTPTVYLPQSIGPLRGGTRPIVRGLLKNIDKIYLRDERSIEELKLNNAVRFPDLAALDINRDASRNFLNVDETPILQVRAIRGKVPSGIYTVQEMLDKFDSYVQSSTGGNNDIPATETLNSERIVSREELLKKNCMPRVVVAMRLHAALMALRAGHYVIHLSYERKGFGAFEDLGLREFVHNVNDFDPSHVIEQANSLLASAEFRKYYDSCIIRTYKYRSSAKQQIVNHLKEIVI